MSWSTSLWERTLRHLCVVFLAQTDLASSLCPLTQSVTTHLSLGVRGYPAHKAARATRSQTGPFLFPAASLNRALSYSIYQRLSKYLLDEEMMLSILGDDKGLERNVFPGCFYYIWMKV